MTRRSALIPILLIIPMMTHWILPSGIEGSLYLDCFGFKYYLFNICYLIYLVHAITTGSSAEYKKKFKLKILFICFVILSFALIHSAIKIPQLIVPAIVNDLNYCYFAFLFILFPLSQSQIQKTKWPIILCLYFLVLEVIIYSLGLKTYSGINDSDTVAFDGVMRISTTIGAATGTAIIITMLGAISITTYNLSKMMLWTTITVTSIGVMFTVSRGGILVWLIFIAVYIYRNYLKHRRLYQKICSLIGISIIFGIMYTTGVFNPIIERNLLKENSTDLSSGRDVRLEVALNHYYDSEYMGVGLAQVYCDKSISDEMPPTYKVAPHNTYVTVLAEQGVIGLILFSLLFVIILANIDYKNVLSILIWLLLLINFNTEAVLLHGEFMAMFMFIAMLTLKRRPQYAIVK